MRLHEVFLQYFREYLRGIFQRRVFILHFLM